MKETDKDFWTYLNANGFAMESYNIDGTYRGKHSSVQYLIEMYNMSVEEAYRYINNVRHI
jgi:hypothetical protein